MSIPLVTTVTEADRHIAECEALMKLPLTERRAQLKAIEEKRGFDAASHIKSTLMALHTKGVKR